MKDAAFESIISLGVIEEIEQLRGHWRKMKTYGVIWSRYASLPRLTEARLRALQGRCVSSKSPRAALSRVITIKFNGGQIKETFFC